MGQFCKYTVGDKVCVFMFINSHTGEWNSADVINMSYSNPFYNPETESLSFAHYLSLQNLSPDVVVFALGTNGMNDAPMTNINGALGIKELVDVVRADDSTIPIVIACPIMQSPQNGIGKQGNTDGYSAYHDFKFYSDKKRVLLSSAIEEILDGYNNVYICPWTQTHDSKYNFGTTKVPVNPRLTSTEDVYEIQPSDSIHPQTVGYQQMAD